LFFQELPRNIQTTQWQIKRFHREKSLFSAPDSTVVALFLNKLLAIVVDCWHIKYDDVEEQLHTSSSVIFLHTQTINQVLESFRPFSTVHKVISPKLGMQL